MTLPLLMTRRYQGEPMNLWIEGKVYRQGRLDATHLEAFHQAEVFWLGNREEVDGWRWQKLTPEARQALARSSPPVEAHERCLLRRLRAL